MVILDRISFSLARFEDVICDSDVEDESVEFGVEENALFVSFFLESFLSDCFDRKPRMRFLWTERNTHVPGDHTPNQRPEVLAVGRRLGEPVLDTPSPCLLFLLLNQSNFIFI